MNKFQEITAYQKAAAAFVEILGSSTAAEVVGFETLIYAADIGLEVPYKEDDPAEPRARQLASQALLLREWKARLLNSSAGRDVERPAAGV